MAAHWATSEGLIVAILYHRSCGHIAVINVDRRAVEARHRQLELMGYFRWRVRVVRMTDDVRERYVADPCPLCWVDPTRAALLPSLSGGGSE
jgi:hypothetical protein